MTQPAFIPCELKRLGVAESFDAMRLGRDLFAESPAAVNDELDFYQSIVDSVEDVRPRPLNPQRIAAVTKLIWRGGVDLAVAFMDGGSAELQNKIIAHANAWGGPSGGNVRFRLTGNVADAQVRIARVPQQGYWSYLGVELLSIPGNQQTLNLDSFSMGTPDREFHRVVRHEIGHTMGMPHEHMRPELVARLNVAKTIRYFQQTQGWSAAEVRAQVLTPLDPRTLTAGPIDQDSIMCYQLPGSITIDGQPIRGGNDINAADLAFCRRIYPPINAPAPPQPVDPAKPAARDTVEAFLTTDAGDVYTGTLKRQASP